MKQEILSFYQQEQKCSYKAARLLEDMPPEVLPGQLNMFDIIEKQEKEAQNETNS